MSDAQDPTRMDLTRIAELLSIAMNLWPLLIDSQYSQHPQTLLQPIDPIQLRASLLHLSEELAWFASIPQEYTLQGITFPPDLHARAKQLAAALEQWSDTSHPPTGVLECARQALRPFFHGTAPESSMQ
jgi:hypothetical protein